VAEFSWRKAFLNHAYVHAAKLSLRALTKANGGCGWGPFVVWGVCLNPDHASTFAYYGRSTRPKSQARSKAACPSGLSPVMVRLMRSSEGLVVDTLFGSDDAATQTTCLGCAGKQK
jgi:hypothetical protein